MASAGPARGPPAHKHVERPRAFVKIRQFGGRSVSAYVRSHADCASHRSCDRTHGQVLDISERQSIDVRIEVRMSEAPWMETQSKYLFRHEFRAAVHGCGWSSPKVPFEQIAVVSVVEPVGVTILAPCERRVQSP